MTSRYWLKTLMNQTVNIFKGFNKYIVLQANNKTFNQTSQQGEYNNWNILEIITCLLQPVPKPKTKDMELGKKIEKSRL